MVDIATGMYAHAAILEALIVRGISGKGRHIEVSMFDVMADWMAVPLLQAEGSGQNPPRLGLRHASITPYGVFTCGDGSTIPGTGKCDLDEDCEDGSDELDCATLMCPG